MFKYIKNKMFPFLKMLLYIFLISISIFGVTLVLYFLASINIKIKYISVAKIIFGISKKQSVLIYITIFTILILLWMILILLKKYLNLKAFPIYISNPAFVLVMLSTLFTCTISLKKDEFFTVTTVFGFIQAIVFQNISLSKDTKKDIHNIFNVKNK